jgi:hypothetical protein
LAALPQRGTSARSAEQLARRILGQSSRATIPSASSGKERRNAFASHPVRSHPHVTFLVLSD